LLIALLIIGLLIHKQMGPGAATGVDQAQIPLEKNAPRVPTNPNDLKKFETQMNDYVKEEAAKRADKLENGGSQ